LLELSQAGCANICIEVPDSAPFTSFLAGQEITPPVCHASPTFKGALVHDNTLVPEGTTEDYPAPEGVIEDSACNALNLGVEFFSSFLSPNSGVTLFSLSSFALSFQLQTSIAAGVRVMYKPKPKSHGCCIMPKHISLSDVECSSRSVPDFGSRFNSV
jgi:hypothetical protein